MAKKKRKKTTKRKTTKRPTKRTSSKRRASRKPSLDPFALAQEIRKGNFSKAKKMIQKNVEYQADKHFKHIKKFADQKTKEIRSKILRTAREDLQKVQKKLNSLTQRVSQLERRVKRTNR